MKIKLKDTRILSGRIEILTGLHIGAGKDTVEIGGIDNPVVKNLHTGEPYIPGSSLKGKLRCLMEWATGRVEHDGKPWEGGGEKDPDKLAADPVPRIFGTTNKNWQAGPTRLVVRDAYLNGEWKQSVIDKGFPFTEEKFENVIDRIKGKAKEGIGVRRAERVPAGAVFDFQMIYRIFDMDDGGQTDQENLQVLLKAMRLLEEDALGGSGSRGYGRIKFNHLKLDEKDIQAEFEKLDPAKLSMLEKVA